MTDIAANTLEAYSDHLANLVAEAEPSVVAVHSHRSRASGFAWRPALVVTADEAFSDEGEVAVTLPGGEQRPATIVGRDPSTDVALLRVEGAAITPIALTARPARAGSLAVAVGASAGTPLVAFGAVAVAGPAWRSMRGGAIDVRLELDLRLSRQAEGGLVLDAGGGALGMAVFGPRRRVLVIPAATIERVAGQLERYGRVPRGYLGLALQPVAVEGEDGHGAMVMSVSPEGPGAAAGLRQGDIIVRWDGEPVPGLGALLRSLGPESVGQRVRLGLRRGGEALELDLTLGERPTV